MYRVDRRVERKREYVTSGKEELVNRAAWTSKQKKEKTKTNQEWYYFYNYTVEYAN